jgi:hypothetical protein
MSNKRTSISVFSLIIVGLLAVFSSSCKPDPIEPRATTYSLKVKDVLGVMGTATFTETTSAVTTIDISLSGAPAGMHPAQLCMNSVVEGGIAAVIMNPVDANGKSSTAITNMTYAQLIAYDGFIKVYKSDLEADVILAQGDIGGNVITTTNKTYQMGTIDAYGVSGTALFEKRLNGNTFVTLTLTGVLAGDSYPATINLGSIASVGGGPVVKTLANVNGTTGKSYTNIRRLNSGVAITYDNWLVYDGYINVYQTTVLSGVVISHGNIGSN